jgi:hypothetical protein
MGQRDDREFQQDEGAPLAEGGYPVDRDGSRFGEREFGDEARNPDATSSDQDADPAE